MDDFDNKLNNFFSKLDNAMKKKAPNIIARTAVEDFKANFTRKSFDGIPWAPYKNKKREPRKGSLMMRNNNLFASIKPSLISSNEVHITAGGQKAPYAKIHNEGGLINRAARSETFIRNRHTKGKLGKMFGGMGAFRKGTTSGKGLTFKAYTINIPKRQFMGKSNTLLNALKNDFKKNFNI